MTPEEDTVSTPAEADSRRLEGDTESTPAAAAGDSRSLGEDTGQEEDNRILVAEEGHRTESKEEGTVLPQLHLLHCQLLPHR